MAVAAFLKEMCEKCNAKGFQTIIEKTEDNQYFAKTSWVIECPYCSDQHKKRLSDLEERLNYGHR